MGYLRRFLYGRYGTDHLSLFLMGIYLLMFIIGSISRIDWLMLIGFPALALSCFRVLSRNHARRRAENAWFLGLLAPLLRWYRTRRAIRRDRDHCYFKCPGCGQRLRVPKGKGKISVTCRACGACFEAKS